MTRLPLEQGRTRQKQKTRATILDAAKRLMGKSRKITLEDVAVEADVSRATIYRYFSNVDLLITEASLDIHYRNPEDLSEEVAGLSLAGRIHYLQEYYNALAQKHEVPFRRYLSTALAESVTSRKKIRGARRVDALKQSLAPYKNKIPSEDYDRLIQISSILMGIDALTVAKDVCGLNNKQTSALLGWAIDRILESMQLKNLR